MVNAKKDENRRQLFKEALVLFADYGYKKTTVEDVARALGMTKGNLYFYVKNKKDLYRQTIQWALGRWQDSVRRAVARERTADNKFRAMGTAALAYIEGDTPFRRLLAKDPDILTLDRKKDRFPEANAAAMDIIREILDQGMAEGIFRVADPDATVRYLFSIYMMFLIQTYVYLDLKDFGQMFDAALELNLGGLMQSSSHP
ncbi:MAG: TetR/AcrR family transcriptional regulator [Desulfobacter sp.]|nr:MAG: TetR/AcrR family transcriptional regulator [Desulfobacter sp.]